MGTVVYVFTGSSLTTAMSMLNPANAITNIELAEDQLKESLSSIKKPISMGNRLSKCFI
jgi:hypothetical protein